VKEREKLTFRIQGAVNGLQPELNTILAEAYEQAEAKVLKFIAQATPSKVKQARILQGLQAQLEKIMSGAYAEVGQEIKTGATDLAAASPRITGKIYNDALQEVDAEVYPLKIPKLSKKLILSWWASFEVEGLYFNQWLEKLSDNSVNRIKKEMIQGKALNEDLRQIAKRMEHSLGASKNGAYGLAQNSFFSAANFGEWEMFQANKEEIKAYRFVAELDRKTTPLCRSLDGQEFTPQETPRPPLHWRCRSRIVPVWKNKGLNDIYLDDGTRPARIETGKHTVKHRDGTTSTKYKNMRAKQLPNRTTWNQWMQSMVNSKNPADVNFAKEALGPKRFSLVKSGKLRVDQLTYAGKLRTIKDLERLYR